LLEYISLIEISDLAMQHIDDQTLISYGLGVLEIEAAAISSLGKNLDKTFADVCRLILSCQGRVIVTGIGKSGHIARKIAATFASTGTPSFFVHPAEAAHGDLGMITEKDLVLAVSKSGETHEILSFAPLLRRRGIKVISLTCSPNSTIAKLADIHLHIKIDREACSLGLAPTASTTATLAMADALAVSLLQARGFSAEDFANSHPGGKLGRSLLIKIHEVMHTGEDLPKVYADTKLQDAILEISQKRLGMTTIVNKHNTQEIIGVCTDGDLRRAFSKEIDLKNSTIEEIMTKNFRTVYSDLLASEAVHLMETNKISALPVLDRDNKLIGALNIHDLFKAGVV
jgi:arabinose-5-phosphate isomerase